MLLNNSYSNHHRRIVYHLMLMSPVGIFNDEIGLMQDIEYKHN